MAIKIVVPKAPVAPALPAAVAGNVSLIREQYPKIGDKIAVMWGSVELHKYLSEIIFDARGGRQGFPAPVISALLQVFEQHSALLPKSDDEDDTWDHVL